MDGTREKDEADGAATSAMRDVFDTIPMKGTVVIGEGEMDEAPMLYIGEKLGTGYGPRVDVAVDPRRDKHCSSWWMECSCCYCNCRSR